ncbi:hypothetical protein Poli38472_011207 [Pythium oligandrum]|uniref:Beta-glucosidase n=1 Tax=Pythium oligandrum TaxID=41045 RepID=A0A8K1CRV8_PYTOL|nr:hypothetical protein Poli38472_011207 [Pythium oligandrum]|eukprot:TMW67587.1 hypothetical protein Poli38472_011207 [Pythium oligandrum]
MRLGFALVAALTSCVVGLQAAADAAEQRCFPDKFLFGTATAAYQVEGGWDELGRTPSIWDDYCREKSGLDCSNVADDFLHRYKSDIQLMSDTGLQSFRFSISWSRVMNWDPETKRMKPNPPGIAFYHSLIDELRRRNIVPILTLYHWDLPTELHNKLKPQGWLNSDIKDHFVEYADLMFHEYGSKVDYWTTFNEPWTFTSKGYGTGEHAPGWTHSKSNAYVAAHNVLLSHGYAVQKFRSLKEKNVIHSDARIGIVLVTDFAYPLNASDPLDVAAAERNMEFTLGWFLTPIVSGDYPEVMRERAGKHLPKFTKEEAAIVKDSYDLFMLNHYASKTVVDCDSPHSNVKCSKLSLGWEGDLGIDGTRLPEGARPSSTDEDGNYLCPWFMAYPQGYLDTIRWMHKQNPKAEILLTENGWCGNGTIANENQLWYYQTYLESVHRAITEDKIPVIGYTAWSFVDNYEWGSFKPRFGLYYVNFTSLTGSTKRWTPKSTELERIPRIAATWYSSLAKTKCMDRLPESETTVVSLAAATDVSSMVVSNMLIYGVLASVVIASVAAIKISDKLGLESVKNTELSTYFEINGHEFSTSANMAAQGKCRELMKPWWDAVPHVADCLPGLQQSPHLEMRYNGLSVWIPPLASMKELMALREAMELVALMAYADENAWAQEVAERTGRLEPSAADRISFFPPKLVVIIEAQHELATLNEPEQHDRVQQMVLSLFTPQPLSHRSTKYRKTRQMLLSCIRDLRRRREAEQLAIKIVVQGRFHNTSLYSTFQSKLEAVYGQQQRGNIPNTLCAFVLDAMSLDFSQFEPGIAATIALRKQLSERQIPLRVMEINYGDKFVEDLIIGSLDGLAHPIDGLDMWLASQSCRPQSFASMFSAFAASSSISKVDITTSYDDREQDSLHRWWLQWLAFTFFSRFSRISAKSLIIRDNFTEEDVASMADIISADNPLSILSRSSEPTCRVMELTEDVMLYADTVRAGTTVWMVHDRSDDPLIDVLVPGYGVQTVGRSKIRPEATPALPSQLTSLGFRIDADTEDFNGLLNLLTLSGANLRHLKIIHDETSEIEVWSIELCQVLRACPLVERVELVGLHVADIAQLGDFFETHDCHLSVLEFSKLRLDANDQVTDFFKTLKDNSSRMSQQLRELCVEIEDAVISSDTLSEIQEMLEVNRTLEVFMLGVPEERTEIIESALTEQPPIFLPVARMPLQLQSKLAFISAVHAPTQASGGLAYLDSGVLSTIFCFAASPQERLVQVFTSAVPFSALQP